MVMVRLALTNGYTEQGSGSENACYVTCVFASCSHFPHAVPQWSSKGGILGCIETAVGHDLSQMKLLTWHPSSDQGFLKITGLTFACFLNLPYLPSMDLNGVIRGMCRLAEVELEQVSNIRIRKGQGNQDIYVQLLSKDKKLRAYYNAAKGVIHEMDIRQAHEELESSRLLDMAQEVAKEDADMDAFRLGLMGG